MDVPNVNRIAEPIQVTEIEGGKYDGDYRVEAECPGCGDTVVHIMDAADSYGPSHRVADCLNRCPGGYNLVRPMEGLLEGSEHRWWHEPPSLSLEALQTFGTEISLNGGEVI